MSLSQFLKNDRKSALTLKIRKRRSNFGILEYLKKSRMSKIGNFSFCWLKRLSFLSKNFWCESFRLSWMPSQCPPRGHISCQLCRCSKTSSSGREEWSARHLVGALSQTRYLIIWPQLGIKFGQIKILIRFSKIFRRCSRWPRSDLLRLLEWWRNHKVFLQ